MESYKDKNKLFRIVLTIPSTHSHINRYILTHNHVCIYARNTHLRNSVGKFLLVKRSKGVTETIFISEDISFRNSFIFQLNLRISGFEK